jgi:uroporphyrinogen-III synthase
MEAPDNPPQEQPIPVLLLKTRSTPGDSYQDAISTAQLPNGQALKPIFIPVLRHQFQEPGLEKIKHLLRNRQISRDADASYGGIIFTSQRAVEAFAHIIHQEKGT